MVKRTGTTTRLLNALSSRLFTALAVSFLLFSGTGRAEDIYCEVMSVEGTATLSNSTTSGKVLAEGDLLSVDDVVRVGPSSYVDIAYDRDWNNVTRIEESSSIRIRKLLPPEVELEIGGVFAKLKSLPKDSTFNVQTPTAIASVRGTEYRTTYLEGETQVYNVSSSEVYVYGLDAAGQKQETEPVVVRNSEKTFVSRRGDTPMAPRRMESIDIQHAAHFKEGIEHRIQQNVERGRVGKLPDVGAIGKRMQIQRQGGEGVSGRQRHDMENRPHEQQRARQQDLHQGPQEAQPQQGQTQQGQKQKPSQARPAGRPRTQR